MFFLFPITLMSMPVILLALAAVIPAVVLLIRIYQADRIEKEPPSLILSLLGLGILSTFCAVITESIGEWVLLLLCQEDSFAYRFLMYFVVVALSEEGFKFLFLKKKTWYNREFNYQFDGIVYAVSVSLGFALFENLEYVFSYGFSTALIRAVTAVPGHACFGVFMGVWYGLAKRAANAEDAVTEKKCRQLALLIPVLLHGTYDFIASLEGDYTWILFILFVLVMFFYTYRLLKQESSRDMRIG
jgi:RsiW-degrading membrane proteinase PrsW (M82 family)